VFGIAALELWASIPTGFALKLNPILNCGATILGASTGVIIVIALGERARNWILRRRKLENPDQEKGIIFRIWQRSGVIGLGLLAPLLVGAPLGAAIGISLGAKPAKFLFWMIIGIVLWSAGLTIAGVLGIQSFSALWYKYF